VTPFWIGNAIAFVADVELEEGKRFERPTSRAQGFPAILAVIR